MKAPFQGNFYIVATPIGNQKDITIRALEILSRVDLILCEDSKKTIPFLRSLKIPTPAKTLHRSDDPRYLEFLWKGLQEGKQFAFVSDAGTPGISDPGSRIVRLLREKSVNIVPVPGPSALATLLSVSGFQANPTLFLGFLSEKKGKKRAQLQKARETEGLIVWYESVHKFPGVLEIIQEVFPEREILIGRELTKIHEEILYYPSIQDLMESPPVWKGEFTILVNNHPNFTKGTPASTDTF